MIQLSWLVLQLFQQLHAGWISDAVLYPVQSSLSSTCVVLPSIQLA